MKLTVKKVMFIVMSVLLLTVIIMGSVMIYLAGDWIFSIFNPSAESGENGQTQPTSSVPASSEPVQDDPTSLPTHLCEFTIKGKTYAPTCDTLGYTLYSCECGRSDFQDYIPALGHDYGEYSVVTATCTTDGCKERTCSRCNKVERTDVVPAGHSFGEWANTDNGIHEQRICSACQITELRSSDTEQTWVLRIAIQEFEGAFTHRQVVVDLADSDKDITYDVYVAEAVTVTGFDYADGVLTVSCTVNGENQNYAVPSDAALLTVHADGNVTTVAPEPEPEVDPDADSDAGEPADEQND